MKKIKKIAVDLWKDESAQGMLEYVLLAVGLIITIAVFRKRFTGWINNSLDTGDSKLGEAFAE